MSDIGKLAALLDEGLHLMRECQSLLMEGRMFPHGAEYYDNITERDVCLRDMEFVRARLRWEKSRRVWDWEKRARAALGRGTDDLGDTMLEARKKEGE